MNRHVACGIAWFAALATPVQLAAQTRDDIRIGARVRVELAGPEKPRTLVGALVSQTPDTMHLRLDHTKEMVAVPIDQARKLDVSLEQHSGAGRGALGGLFVGLALGVAAGGSCDCGEPGLAALVLGGVLGGLGTGFGALLGTGVRVDEWTPVIPAPARRLSSGETHPGLVTLLQLPF